MVFHLSITSPYLIGISMISIIMYIFSLVILLQIGELGENNLSLLLFCVYNLIVCLHL